MDEETAKKQATNESIMSRVTAALEKYDVACEEVKESDAAEAVWSEHAEDCIAEIRDALDEVKEVPVNLNNPIAKLQERAQSTGKPLPVYVFSQVGESHVPTFSCTCTYDGSISTHTGPTKQKAKRRAAHALLGCVIGSAS